MTKPTKRRLSTSWTIKAWKVIVGLSFWRLSCKETGKRRSLRIERLGRLSLLPGYYIYVGSAFGRGGLKARLNHHRRPSPQPHWHVDYLKKATRLEAVWFTFDPIPREHQWAGLLGEPTHFAIPLKGFGASDCGCLSHLYFSEAGPSFEQWRKLIFNRFPEHSAVEIVERENFSSAP